MKIRARKRLIMHEVHLQMMANTKLLVGSLLRLKNIKPRPMSPTPGEVTRMFLLNLLEVEETRQL
jgi:hypothetical protein